MNELSTSPLALPLSDVELHARNLSEREQSAASILSIVEQVLQNASNTIDDLERDDSILAPAILRCCNDMADEVNSVAKKLNEQSSDERRSFARAVIDDAKGQLALTHELNEDGTMLEDVDLTTIARRTRTVANLSEEEMMDAVSGAETILWDVEEVLRSIGKNEAEEIAEVGLVVAKMFVWVLQGLHKNITPSQLAGTEEERRFMNDINTEPNDSHPPMSSPELNTDPQQLPRTRILWPPLAPTLLSAGKWGCDQAVHQPFISAALAMTLWPAAIFGAFVGTPLVVADGVLQKGYDALSSHPIVATAEHGAYNLCQVAKLYFLCGKLVLKQGLRVGKRQIERRGGVGQVAKDVGGLIFERAMHPVETTQMLIDGVGMGVNGIMDFVSGMKNVVDERRGGVGSGHTSAEVDSTNFFHQKELL